MRIYKTSQIKNVPFVPINTETSWEFHALLIKNTECNMKFFNQN